MATCHLLSGATWPASRHRSHHRTFGQRWSTVATDGQRRRSTVADHQSTTTGPPINHHWTTCQPPPDHRSTTAGPRVNDGGQLGHEPGQVGSWAEFGSGQSGSGSGRPRGMPRGVHVSPHGVHVAADVDYIPQLGVEPGPLA
ncbi:hypothetical protein Tco_0332900 [Tanacetum coccineum]